MNFNFVLLFLWFVVAVKAIQNGTLSSHLLSKRSANDCRGGSGKYITYWNTNMNNGHNANSVGKCFGKVRGSMDIGQYGCKKESHGNCRCVADSSYIYHYHQTFDEALNQLKRGSDNFHSIEAERFEGSMYLSYTC